MAKSNRPVVHSPADSAITPAPPQAEPAAVAPAVASFPAPSLPSDINAARVTACFEVHRALTGLLEHAARRAAEIEPQQRDAVHLATARKWFIQWFKGINNVGA